MRRSACLLISILLFPLLSACGAPAASPTLTPVLASPTASQTASVTLTETLIPPLTTLSLPSATPRMYTIAKGDTLGAIAARFHVSVEAILAANPTVQPSELVVGKTLVIPAPASSAEEPLPTPAPVKLLQAHCWPEAAGGLWCFALVRNDFAETLENISMQFALLDASGQEKASQSVYGLVDILPGGRSMALAAHFPAPVPAGAAVRAQVLTGIRLLPGDTRYLPVVVENTLVSLEASGKTAQVSGKVRLTADAEAKTLWVLAVAYDAAGNVIGLRRWESAETLTQANPLSFAFQLYSMGPAIARVDFLTEARP